MKVLKRLNKVEAVNSKKVKIIFRKNLTEKEKEELRKLFQGQYFSLNDALRNGLELFYNDLDFLKNRFSKYADKIVEAKTEVLSAESRGTFKVKLPELEFELKLKTFDDDYLTLDVATNLDKLSKDLKAKCSEEVLKLLKKQPEWDKLDSDAKAGIIDSTTSLFIPNNSTFWFK